MSAESTCLAKGVEIGNLLARTAIALETGDRDMLNGAAEQLKATIGNGSCIVAHLRDQAVNEAAALVSFVGSRNTEGVEQAVASLRRDLGFPEIKSRFERPGGPLRQFRKAPGTVTKTLGYQVFVDGKMELKFVPRSEREEALQSFIALNPGRKVELLPIEMEAPAPVKAEVPVTSKERLEFEVRRAQPATERSAYTEIVRAPSPGIGRPGKILKEVFFDAEGNKIGETDYTEGGAVEKGEE